MGNFGETCPICNAEINPPQEQDRARPGFRPETGKKKPGGQYSPGRKRKKKRRR